MDNELHGMLCKELKSEIQNLSKLGSGTKEKASAVQDVEKLYKLTLEETKDNNETLSVFREDETRRSQNRKEEVSRNIRLGTDIAIFLAEVIFASYWARRGFKFEEDGTFKSGTLRNLFSRFKFSHGNKNG